LPESPYDRRKVLLIFLLVLVPALFFLGWSQASLNLSFIRPQSPEQTLLLLSLSAVIFLAFVIFALILLRILLKLYVERRQQRLGSRFKTTMVVAFLALSLVPVCFLFAFAYGLLNRTIDRWFSIPLDLIRADSGEIVRQLQSHTQSRSSQIAQHLAGSEALLNAVAASARTAFWARWNAKSWTSISSPPCALIAKAGSSPRPAIRFPVPPKLSGCIPNCPRAGFRQEDFRTTGGPGVSKCLSARSRCAILPEGS